MSSGGSVTRWLASLQAGHRDAVGQLWERYFRRLVGLARRKLNGKLLRAADEEDVALSAFESFCRHTEQGRLPQLQDRDGLWRLLAVITARKAAHLLRDEGRRPAEVQDLEQVLSREPTPAFAAGVADECLRLLRRLDDKDLEAVALLRMEGYTVAEVAARLECAPRTVKRMLHLIRTIWEKEIIP
jgi:DNA-directed RNA polymerase specialized sigma24 family protein